MKDNWLYTKKKGQEADCIPHNTMNADYADDYTSWK